LIPDDDTASVQIIEREIDTTLLMTLYRVLGDGSRTLVRGATGLIDQITPTDDTYLIQDYEAPLGQPFSYRIEFYSTSTGLLTEWRTTSTVTLNPADDTYVWLKDPSMPQLNCYLHATQAPDWQRGIEQAVYR